MKQQELETQQFIKTFQKNDIQVYLSRLLIEWHHIYARVLLLLCDQFFLEIVIPRRSLERAGKHLHVGPPSPSAILGSKRDVHRVEMGDVDPVPSRPTVMYKHVRHLQTKLFCTNWFSLFHPFKIT